DATPPTFVVLATANLEHWESQGQAGWATLGLYRSSGTVFTAASTNWADPIESSPVVDRITHNVLTRLSRRYPDHDWEAAGTAPGVWSMREGGGGLMAVRHDGALIFREASGQNLRWRHVEHAGTARTLTRVGAGPLRRAGLLLASHDGALWWREAVLKEA